MGLSLIEDIYLYCPWCGMTRNLPKYGGFLREHCEEHIENGDEKRYDGFVEAYEMEPVVRGL